MASPAQLPEKFPTLDPSRDMLTQKTAVNTTSAWRESPVNTDAQSEPSSRSEMLTVLETAKTQKMFPDGKILFSHSF